MEEIKEIETKARLKNRDEVLRGLSLLGVCFGDSFKQTDTYYAAFEGDFTLFRPYENFLRIREVNGVYEFTLKQPQSNELDVIERTTKISDKKVLHDIILFLGFKEIITVTKERRHASYKEWTLCLDEVENLGSFLEIEYIGTKNVELVQKEEKDFLKTLLISEEDIVISGYDTMLYKKLFSKNDEK